MTNNILGFTWCTLRMRHVLRTLWLRRDNSNYTFQRDSCLLLVKTHSSVYSSSHSFDVLYIRLVRL